MNKIVKYIKLKELCTVNQGLQIPIGKRFKENKENRYFYITVQFLKDAYKEKYYIENPPKSSICKKEDILVVRTGNTGQIITGVEGSFHNNFFKVNYNRNKIFGRFLYYCLITKEKQREMAIRAGITTIPDLNHFMFLDIKIPFIEDLKKQEKISKTLDIINAKIELNNKTNTKLEAMAKTIYDYWFVQFDFPDKNGKPYKTSGGKMVWSEELKRDVPDGWDIDKLNTRIKIGSGFPFDSDDYNNVGKYKIITIKNVQDNSLETNTADKIDFIPQNLSKFCKLEIGDVLMSLTGNVGRMCFVDEDNLLLNQRVGKILGEKDFIIFGYLYFKRPENQKRLEKISGGSSQANLSPVDAVKDYFAIPPDNILNEFSKIVTPIFNQIINNKKENKKLVELRDWLLPMLMNGQIKVN